MNFPKEFFQDEYRCDFLVPEMMKRAWATQIEVLLVIDEICKKHGLRYFADSGTLLGAVRHKGFIPWDDDIDINMLRSDYDKLISILPGELPDGFSMAGMYAGEKRLQDAVPALHQRVITDETYWSLTTHMNRFHACPFFRLGVDILALDNIPRNPEDYELQRSLVTYVFKLLGSWDEFLADQSLESYLQYVEETCMVTLKRDDTLKNQVWRLLDSICCLYNDEDAEEVAIFPYVLNKPYNRPKKAWFAETVYLPFENIEIPAPKHYHEVLTAQYKDYSVYQKMSSGHNYPCYREQEDSLSEILKKEGITASITEFCHNWANLIEEQGGFV